MSMYSDYEADSKFENDVAQDEYDMWVTKEEKEIYHIIKDKTKILLSEMTDQHLLNCQNLCRSRGSRYWWELKRRGYK